MARQRTKVQKAALNTAFAALSEFVQVACGLILPRIILARFGSAYNGITSSVQQLFSAVSILTVGISGTTRVALYRPLADHDIEKTSSIIKATELYMRKVGTALLGMLALLIAVYPAAVETGYTWADVAPLILAAGISALGTYYFGTAYNALLIADQNIYISRIFLIIANILNVLISIFLIRRGYNIQTVKLISSLVLVMSPVLRALYVRKKYRLNSSCEPDHSALSMRKDVMAHSIASIVHDHTDTLVLTIFCNVRIVSVYTVYNLVMSVLKKTRTIFTTGSEGLFGELWAKGEISGIKKSLEYYEFIVAVFVSVVFSTAMVMILPFISLYTKGVHDVEYMLPAYAVTIIIAHMFYSFRTPYQTLVQGAGHYRQTRNGAYMEAGINLCVSVILVQFMGIVGTAVGTLAANLFRTIQYALYIEDNIISRGKKVFLYRIIWALGNVLAITAITYGTASRYAYEGWVSWAVTAVIVTITGTILTILSSLVFYRKDMKSFTDMIKKGLFPGKK